MVLMKDDFSVQDYGGKGASLLRLRNLGYNVPPFIIIHTNRFGNFMNDAETANVETIAAYMRDVDIISEIAGVLGNARSFAVRSSAVAEDSADYSFAGQFHTELNVALNDIPEAIARVWMSGMSAPASAYKATHGIDAAHRMAVIIQEMVPASAAGVGFGVHPLTGDASVVVMNAVHGLGDALVSGEISADTYEVDSAGKVDIKAISQTPVLTEVQIQKVAETVRSLGKDFSGPQDIEFAFAQNWFYLLQSRPVTTNTGHSRNEPATVWDNSNIVESYPELTLPLTFSFIEKMYAAVYRQFTLVLGVGKSKVAASDSIFKAMLGLLNGRVYYNLNSWYAALALLPGYSINARFMEGMMGVKEPPPVPMPVQRKAGISDYLYIIRAVLAIIKNLKQARKGRDVFVRQFDEVYNGFSTKDFTTQDVEQTWQDYTAFEQLMVAEWKAPLVNDFFAMIYFGLLKKLTVKHLPGLPHIHNELVGASKDIVTTQPLKLLPQLARMLTEDVRLKELAWHESPETLWTALQSPEYTQELQAINEYLTVWGERCVAELKLETVTYLQEPVRLIAILQSYIQGGIPAYQEQHDDIRKGAEEQLQQAFYGKWLQRKIFNHVLRQARYFVSNRENLRYYRTRGFGLVRCMMLGIGRQLVLASAIENVEDIFYLKLTDIENWVGAPYNLSPLVKKRRETYKIYYDMPLPERVITTGAVPEYIVAPPTTGTAKNIAQGNLLQGIPCSAGVVRARIRRVYNVSALSSLEGCIMATYATDPGYVVLFPTAVGILTERGSLLSHAAIVSREMGIPCIVGIDGLMERLKDGDEVVMDGRTGTVQILSVND